MELLHGKPANNLDFIADAHTSPTLQRARTIALLSVIFLNCKHKQKCKLRKPKQSICPVFFHAFMLALALCRVKTDHNISTRESFMYVQFQLFLLA